MTPVLWIIAIIWAGLLPLSAWLLRHAWLRQSAGQRLQTHLQSDADPDQAVSARSWLGWWLYRAGFRSPQAPWSFAGLTLLGFLIGGLGVWLVTAMGAVVQLELILQTIPGGVGEVFLPFVWASPWLAASTLAAIPALVVRRQRLRRITAIEQDLPITLDLFSTLAEAGLSFDAALARILVSQRDERPLAMEFQIFQLDLLAGRSRVEALRRLMTRIDVPWFSLFISAVMHAEQIGAGLAQTLKNQAEDLRNRRRERALALAMAVPVKLLFPLIVCFLPGIMAAALGPILFQIVQVLDQFLSGSL